MSEFRRQFGNVFRKITGVRPDGHGPYHEAEGGWVDPKPYLTVESNGLFEGYRGDKWVYFKVPDDVKVQWTKDPMEAARNQHFLVDVCNQFSLMLNNYSSSERGDERRNFHISMTRDSFGGIKPHKSHTPAARDYYRRMSNEYDKPVWHGYMGIQLIPSNGMEEAHGIVAKAERWWEMMRNPEDLSLHLYQSDYIDVVNVMTDHGFTVPDFSTEEGMRDYSRLTAWHGIEDTDFDLNRELVTTRMQEPIHGLSIITPRWGEITMGAIKPIDERFMVDPISSGARWGDAVLGPANDVVVVSIRGEIRSKDVANAMFENKYITKRGAQSAKKAKVHSDQDRKEMSMLERAQSFAASGHSMLDNVEIIVGTMVTKDSRKPKLSRALQPYGLTVLPLVNRQPIAVNSTFPTYPKPILPHKRSNKTRAELSNQMFPGILAMSGLLRSTKVNWDRGFLVGLSDGGAEYKEVWTDIEGASKENATPGFLYSGRPGAGKTQCMLQHLAQTVYNGYRGFFLNPKPSSTLKHFFDLLGGVTVTISNEYLNENPGCFDPMFFLSDRSSVASLLSDSIFILTEMDQERGTKATQLLSKLNSEISDRCMDIRNTCSGHVIFGRPDEGSNGGISNEVIKEIISNTMNSSPFWKAFVSMSKQESDLHKKILGSMDRAGLATLIEWDRGLQLPDSDDIKSGKRLSSAQVDSIISVNAALQYATEIVGQNRTGGGIWIDEAWVINTSPEMKRRINAGLREFRERNIFLGLGTQRLGDFIKDGEDDMASYVSRFMIMAISDNDPKELDIYFKLTGLPRTQENIDYIINAGAKRFVNGQRTDETERIIPKAYYIDRIYGFEGGVIMGPWPSRELNAGKTDKESYMRRQQAQIDGSLSKMGQLGLDIENDLLKAATEDDSLRDIGSVQ